MYNVSIMVEGGYPNLMLLPRFVILYEGGVGTFVDSETTFFKCPGR